MSDHHAARGARGVLRALRHRNYRLYFCGQSLSLVGTWLTRVATSWLVYRLTDSALMLGIVGFAGQIPAFVLAPLAGVLVDRWDRHRLLVITQILSMFQPLALAALALSHTVAVWHIVVLSVFQGVINAFDMPCRQAFLVELVEDRNDLGNAIALNSSMFNGAWMVGPSIAGVLIASFGEGICFLLNGISYLPVIASLLAMRVRKREVAAEGGSLLRGLVDGFRFAFGFAPIRSILLLVALTGLMGLPYIVLMPVLARDVLHGGARTFGFLMTSNGIGALSGALYLASRGSVRGLGGIIPVMAATGGVGLILLSWSRALGLSLPLLAVIGFAVMLQTAASNTILQTIVDDDKRGRVMSLYTTALLGMVPFGSLLAGEMAARLGAPFTLAIDGVAMLVGAVLFGSRLRQIRAMVRPIYVKQGIIPEVAAGIPTTSQLTGQPKK